MYLCYIAAESDCCYSSIDEKSLMSLCMYLYIQYITLVNNAITGSR